MAVVPSKRRDKTVKTQEDCCFCSYIMSALWLIKSLGEDYFQCNCSRRRTENIFYADQHKKSSRSTVDLNVTQA